MADRQDQESSHIQLDLSKGLRENIREVLTNITLRHGVSNVKKLGYLNAIVKLVSENNESIEDNNVDVDDDGKDNDNDEYGFTSEELFCCLRVGLIQEATQVRAAALRAIRYLLKKQQDVIMINNLQYPYFIARSMDINLKNEMERLQALRLVRRILILAPNEFSPILARSLISLTNGGVEEKDRTFRVFLATLCELGVLNSNLLISCGGVGILARSALTAGLSSPAMIESVIGVLLQLISKPETRKSVSLLCLAAPYCELYSSLNERSLRGDSRETRFAASKQALLSVLRSYSGVLNFCHPNDNSGLKAIADILYVEQLEVRGAVLELLYELLGLPLPIWTDEPDVALAAVDPCRPRDNWKLSEGFVAAEGRSILPPLASHCPNITEIHLGLLVYVLLECGLHRALAETIVTSDTFISVRAAVLLGALLHLAHSLLPPDVCDLTPPLPNLLEHASIGRHQALAAVAILGRMHAMMRRKPAPSSLFLDRILQAGTWLRPSSSSLSSSSSLPPSRRQQRRSSTRNWLRRESLTASSSTLSSSSSSSSLLKDSQVLSSKDALAWNWPIIRSILRSREDSIRLLHDSDHKLFVKRLVRYFKPSSNRYSRVELISSVSLAREATLAGCDLINCLLEIHESSEGTRLLNELIGDIDDQISAIKSQSSAHDCLFSPRHMTTTCCQKYFLFLGQLSHSAKGTVILKAFNLLEKMEELAIATNHDCYVKLIISSLDYTREGPNRKVLSKIISSATLEQTRLYATQFLRLILRARMTDAVRWAVTLLIDKLTDDSKSVALAALDALHEASEDSDYLEIFFQQCGHNKVWNKWLLHLGDRGYLLNTRFYSLRAGFTTLPSPSEELEKWMKPVGGFSERYVGLIEGEIHDSLTRRQRGENGSYLRRQSSSNMLVLPRDVFIPPHLLGQLVQHELGIQLLTRNNVVQRLARIINKFIIDTGGTTTMTTTTTTVDTETSSFNIRKRSNQLIIDDDSGSISRESVNDHEIINESINRLETIIDDAEIMDTTTTAAIAATSKMQYLSVSPNASRRTTTPEKYMRNNNQQESSLSSLSSSSSTANTDERILRVKSALWASGHYGTSPAGVDHLKQYRIIEMITSLAETCQYYTIKATAMYSLSLIATTRAGADALALYDWPCVRYKRGDYWPIVQPTRYFPVPSPVPIQKHHRSLSDGKPGELPDPIVRRTRNRSESAATADIEVKRLAFPERGVSGGGGETPSPISSVQRLSQQDAEGYARLRSLQRHRRPSYSHSSLEMYNSSDGRLSLQSLSEFESSRSWTTDNILTSSIIPLPSLRSTAPSSSPPPPPPSPPREEDASDTCYMGVCLPKRLQMIFPQSTSTTVSSSIISDTMSNRSKIESTNIDEDDDATSPYNTGNHSKICLICYKKRETSTNWNEKISDTDIKIRKEILRHTQRLSNPVWYRHSRQTLLRLRQKYPEKFQDTCLFSEVASRLGNGTYRLQARRFLQELFLDSSFDGLYVEPMNILKIPLVIEKNHHTQSQPPPSSPAEVVVVKRLTETHMSTSPDKHKLNGRLTISEIRSSSPTTSDFTNQMSHHYHQHSYKCSKSVEKTTKTTTTTTTTSPAPPQPDKLSDEEIIAEILKPAEKLRMSKSSDNKLLKVATSNTAISLD